MIIAASSFDLDIVRVNAGLAGKVHSLYKSAITLDFDSTMITILPAERGEGPGFVLISPESGFPPRTLLKPGDKVEIDRDCSRIKTGGLEIILEKAKGFSSLLLGRRVAPAPVGNISRSNMSGAGGHCCPICEEKEKDEEAETTENTDRQKLIKFIGEYFLKADNAGNSLLSRVSPELRGVDLQCSIGSCVLSVWKESVDDILEDLTNSIKNRDGEMFGETLKRLVGMGWGLTPGGDDFILGMLGFTSFILANREKTSDIAEETGRVQGTGEDDSFIFINRQIRKYLPGFLNKTGFISASYLTYALEGRYVVSFTNFLQSLMKENMKELEMNLEKLTEYGATSGMDIVAGVIFLMCSESWS